MRFFSASISSFFAFSASFACLPPSPPSAVNETRHITQHVITYSSAGTNVRQDHHRNLLNSNAIPLNISMTISNHVWREHVRQLKASSVNLFQKCSKTKIKITWNWSQYHTARDKNQDLMTTRPVLKDPDRRSFSKTYFSELDFHKIFMHHFTNDIVDIYPTKHILYQFHDNLFKVQDTF